MLLNCGVGMEDMSTPWPCGGEGFEDTAEAAIFCRENPLGR